MPPETQSLARYISIGLLSAMVRNRGLNFTRFDRFIDEFDGAIPPFTLRTNAAYWREKRRHARLAKASEVSKRVRKISSVSCWTMTEDISETMFNLIEINGGARRELAIKSSIARVCAALEWPDDVSNNGYRGPVLYCDDDFDVMQNMGVLRNFFWKRTKWRGENEYRFVYHPDFGIQLFRPESFNYALASDVHWMKCDISSLIEAIFIRSTASDDTVENVKRLCGSSGISIIQL